jgi:hypothetical protein
VTTVFLICAVTGGTLFVCQLVMMLLGGGEHHDVGGDVDHDVTVEHAAHGHTSVNAIWSLLSFRSIVTAVTVFGLAGMTAEQSHLARPVQVLVAVASGLASGALLAYLMRSLFRLQDDGTAHIERARGATGTVYISIPGDNTGRGKVQIELQNRTVEVEAVTPKSALETGTRVVVVDVVNPETVEVIAVPQRSVV